MKAFISAALVVAVAAITASAQPAQTLSALTAPAAVLPDGCALIPPAPANLPQEVRGGRVVVKGATMTTFPSNPWKGTDTTRVMWVRGAFDRPRRALPDLPPMSEREIAEANQKSVANILEAYHADYISTDGFSVDVNAITFNDATFVPAETLSDMVGAHGGLHTRLVRGATLVLVTAQKATSCARAIDTHVRSLK